MGSRKGLAGMTCVLSLHAEGEAGHGEVEQGDWGAGGGCLSLRGGGKAREEQRWRQESVEEGEGAADDEEERAHPGGNPGANPTDATRFWWHLYGS